jgi:glycosyltransferase involved in cell wall biosynthesis
MTATGRALIIVENMPVPLDRRVWREAETLRDAGWTVTVICPATTQGTSAGRRPALPRHEVIQGITVHRFPLAHAQHGILGYAREYLSAWVHIARLTMRLRRHPGFEVVQFCNPPDIFFPLAALLRLLGHGVIFDHHDLFPEGIAFRFRGPRGRLAYRIALLMERLTYRAVDVAISTNESYRAVALQRDRFDPARLFIVRNGPELSRLNPAPAPASLPGDARYTVSFLGVMGEDDGIEEMMAAIQYIARDAGRRDIRYIFIGDGPMRRFAEERIASLGLQEQAWFTGLLLPDQFKGLIAASDVCLAPDPCAPLNHLSTNTKIMDYMAAGRPAVAFRLKETVYSAAEAAVYVPCGDTAGFGQAILALLDDPERRRRMGKAGRERFATVLAWEYQQPALLAAYATASAAPHRRGGGPRMCQSGRPPGATS